MSSLFTINQDIHFYIPQQFLEQGQELKNRIEFSKVFLTHLPSTELVEQSPQTTLKKRKVVQEKVPAQKTTTSLGLNCAAMMGVMNHSLTLPCLSQIYLGYKMYQEAFEIGVNLIDSKQYKEGAIIFSRILQDSQVAKEITALSRYYLSCIYIELGEYQKALDTLSSLTIFLYINDPEIVQNLQLNYQFLQERGYKLTI
ncbi:MAG: hypothetical protein K0S74_1052 [Chlamydiales bacterium]|jgi:tetratricopeptide (TPR) repeat protein|nr:hypothetical protein [Chlamydiales bacterium]